MADEKDKRNRQEAPSAPPATPAAPRPIRLDVTSTGECGEYTFDIQVVSNQGQGIKAKILIIEGNRHRAIKETDEDGFLDGYQAQPFQDEEREFRFIVKGTDIWRELMLDGPEPEPKPKQEKIKPLPGAGFLANVRNAIKINQQRKENL